MYLVPLEVEISVLSGVGREHSSLIAPKTLLVLHFSLPSCDVSLWSPEVVEVCVREIITVRIMKWTRFILCATIMKIGNLLYRLGFGR